MGNEQRPMHGNSNQSKDKAGKDFEKKNSDSRKNPEKEVKNPRMDRDQKEFKDSPRDTKV